mmetsp:Transcript_9833/g.16205  ORF Transcript_9833/g.16205 Transcript_9833/m.16205 type:complete len:594 (-) Transcript_9833:435-2216(-)
MAGRGRGATLPAWMTGGGAEPANAPHGGFENGDAGVHPGAANGGQYADYSAAPPSMPPVDEPVLSTSAVSDGHHSHVRGDGQRRSAERGGSSRRRDRSVSKDRSRYVWKPKAHRVSNFDVRPPDGVELPPIGVAASADGVPNSYRSFANNPHAPPPVPPGNGYGSSSGGGYGSKYGAGPSHGAKPPSMAEDPAMMQTRHARRVYAGGIPPMVSEEDLLSFFTDTVVRATGMPVHQWPSGPPVLKIYLNAEKCYAFVEFSTIELTTACMALDGISYQHPRTGALSTLRIRRPNDYRPELLPPAANPLPQFNLSILGISPTAAAGGGGGRPGGGAGGPSNPMCKIFVGGLPYNLQDEQVMELLAAFGPIKSFHQVRDPGSVTSKGYGFCEYMEPADAEKAIGGLNGLPLGEKTLTVRIASLGASSSSSSATSSSSNYGGNAMPLQQQQQIYGGYAPPQQQQLPPQAPPMPMYGGGPPGPSSNAAYGMVPPQMPQTRVLRLSNMVSTADLYDEAEYTDIIEDVRLECQQYGQVDSVIIPRVKDGYQQAAEGLIFVQFQLADGAALAAKALNGRKFADKIVVVQPYNERDFAMQQLK